MKHALDLGRLQGKNHEPFTKVQHSGRANDGRVRQNTASDGR